MHCSNTNDGKSVGIGDKNRQNGNNVPLTLTRANVNLSPERKALPLLKVSYPNAKCAIKDLKTAFPAQITLHNM